MKNIFPLLSSVFCLLSSVISAQVTPNFSYTQTCYGNQTTLVATSALPDANISSWQWDLNGDGVYEKSGKMIISLITVNDTIAVKLKITPTSGSADSITSNVIIDPLPTVNFFASNLCEGTQATYISQSMVATGNITQSKWDFNNDGVDDAFGDTATYTSGPPSTYVTKLTCVTDKGCSAFSQKVTTVYANPVAAFSTANVCENVSASFTNTSTITNLDFYLWNFGDGNSNSTQGNATHAYTTAGTYTADLIAVTQEGCRDTVSSSIIINPIPIVSISGNTTECFDNNFNLTASGGINYLWSNGSSAQTLVTAIPATYSVTVTDNNGCSNIVSVTATDYPLVQVSISGKDTLPPGGSVELIANGANTYLWSTGETTNNISVSQSGTYAVTGTDLNGCMNSDSLKVVAENPDLVSVSGFILTPNDDNINDALVINNISEYANCDLMIYNSWNDEVFSVTGYKNDWKGTNASGAELTAGAYYYIIKCDDKALLKGNINILR